MPDVPFICIKLLKRLYILSTRLDISIFAGETLREIGINAASKTAIQIKPACRADPSGEQRGKRVLLLSLGFRLTLSGGKKKLWEIKR